MATLSDGFEKQKYPLFFILIQHSLVLSLDPPPRIHKPYTFDEQDVPAPTHGRCRSAGAAAPITIVNLSYRSSV